MNYYSKEDKLKRLRLLKDFINLNPGIDINIISQYLNLSKKTTGIYLKELGDENKIYFKLTNFNKRIYFIKEQNNNEVHENCTNIRNNISDKIILFIKSKEEGVTYLDVVKEFKISKGTVSGILQSLYKKNILIKDKSVFPMRFKYNYNLNDKTIIAKNIDDSIDILDKVQILTYELSNIEKRKILIEKELMKLKELLLEELSLTTLKIEVKNKEIKFLEKKLKILTRVRGF